MTKSSKQFARHVLTKICGSRRQPRLLHPRWLFLSEYYRTLLSQSGVVQGKVLDVGSGDRHFEQAFRDQYIEYMGLDYPAWSGFVDVRHVPLPDVGGDGQYLPFAGGTFDTVFLFEVLEHCPDPAQMLSQISAVLKTGGVLLLTVPLTIPEHSPPHDYYRYTQFGLRYLLEDAGFSVEQIVPIGGVGTIVASHLNYAMMEGTFSRGSALTRLLKLCASPLVLLIWLVINLVGGLLNWLLPNPGFVMGYCVVAKKE